MDINKSVQENSQIGQGGILSPNLDITQKPMPPKKPEMIRPKKPSRLPEKAEIRTMDKDIEMLKRKGFTPSKKPETFIPSAIKKPAPPEKLPVIESIKKPVPPKPEPIPSFKKPSFIKKYSKMIVILGIAIIVIISGLIAYSFLKKEPTHFVCQDLKCVEIEGKGENQCLVDEDCFEKEPQSLINVDKTETIDLTLGAQTEQKTLLQLIEQTAQNQTKGSIIRILVKLTDESGQDKYASLSQISTLLGISMHQELVNNEHTLYLYIPQEDEKEICQQNNISDEKCFGPRLGLVIKTEESVKDLLNQWENTMVNDLRPLILSDLTTEQLIDFQDDDNALYQGNDIRYQNLGISPIAVNYGFSNNLLLIGTSKYCLYEALDRLK